PHRGHQAGAPQVVHRDRDRWRGLFGDRVLDCDRRHVLVGRAGDPRRHDRARVALVEGQGQRDRPRRGADRAAEASETGDTRPGTGHRTRPVRAGLDKPRRVRSPDQPEGRRQHGALRRRGACLYAVPGCAKGVFAIAGALGLDTQQVIPEPPRKDEQGFRPANRARITIIERDVAAGMRYWAEPHVQLTPDGTAAVLTNLARFRDGQGEARCVMWNRDGMVPTTIYGGTGSGKSAAVNAITIGAMSTGLLNSIYVDFKGNSSLMMRSRARIVVVGRDAVA